MPTDWVGYDLRVLEAHHDALRPIQDNRIVGPDVYKVNRKIQ